MDFFRYSFFHVLNEAKLMDKELAQKWISNYNIGKLTFRATTFVEVANKVLKDVLEAIAKTKSQQNHSLKDVIIFHFGSWDASYRYNNLKQDLFKDFIPNLTKLVQTLNKTLHNETFSNVTLIWATCPSSPFKHIIRRMRNPFDLGSLTSLGYDLIKNMHDIKILDMYSITNTLNKQTAAKCGSHYICRNKGQVESRGNVGKAYMDVLNYIICDYGTLNVDVKTTLE